LTSLPVAGVTKPAAGDETPPAPNRKKEQELVVHPRHERRGEKLCPLRSILGKADSTLVHPERRVSRPLFDTTLTAIL